MAAVAGGFGAGLAWRHFVKAKEAKRPKKKGAATMAALLYCMGVRNPAEVEPAIIEARNFFVDAPTFVLLLKQEYKRQQQKQAAVLNDVPNHRAPTTAATEVGAMSREELFASVEEMMDEIERNKMAAETHAPSQVTPKLFKTVGKEVPNKGKANKAGPAEAPATAQDSVTPKLFKKVSKVPEEQATNNAGPTETRPPAQHDFNPFKKVSKEVPKEQAANEAGAAEARASVQDSVTPPKLFKKVSKVPEEQAANEAGAAEARAPAQPKGFKKTASEEVPKEKEGDNARPAKAPVQERLSSWTRPRRRHV